MPTPKHIATALIILLAAGCGDDSVNPSLETFNVDDLTQEWTHSWEEETDSVQIYRPSDYQEFPITRYRQIYWFEADSTCQYLVLASNDGHFYRTGTWAYNADSKILTIAEPNGVVLRRFEVIELTNDILRITCDDDNYSTIYEYELTVPVQVDLWDGFAGHDLHIAFNGHEYFADSVSTLVPFAGPSASFSCNLPRGLNQVSVSWQRIAVASIVYWDTLDFHLGDADQYYMGINISADSLTIVVQESAFLYL